MRFLYEYTYISKLKYFSISVVTHKLLNNIKANYHITPNSGSALPLSPVTTKLVSSTLSIHSLSFFSPSLLSLWQHI